MLNQIDDTVADSDRIEQLVAWAKGSTSEAQQLAIAASLLLSNASDRIDAAAGAGFFKRCWFALSGKTGEIQRGNQADLIRLQKFAARYLSMLQEQNLLQTNAISIIRRNLSDLADVDAGTQTVIEGLIEKLGPRIKNLEDRTARLEWSNGLEKNKRSHSRLSHSVLGMMLAFDYASSMQFAGVAFEQLDIKNDLEIAFLKFELDGSTVSTVLDLMLDVIQDPEMDATAFSRMVKLTALNGAPINSSFIAENVSSIAARAVYSLEPSFWAIEGTTEKDRFAEKFRTRMADSETRYTLFEFAQEIVEITFFAVDLANIAALTEQTIASPRKLSEIDPPQRPVRESLEHLLGGLVPVTRHAFLNANASNDDKSLYLESFALIACSSSAFAGASRSYLVALAESFGIEGLEERFDWLTADQSHIPLKAVAALVGRNDVCWSWLADATFLYCLGDRADAAPKQCVLDLAKVMNLPIDSTRRYVAYLETISTDEAGQSLIEAIKGAAQHSPAWKTIVDYRKLSFAGAFKGVRDAVWGSTSFGPTFEQIELLQTMTTKQFDVINSQSVLPEMENLLQRATGNIARRICVSDFNSLKTSTEEFASKYSTGLKQAREICRAFGVPVIAQEEVLSTQKADDNVSGTNEKWSDNMDRAYAGLHAYLEDFCGALSDAWNKLHEIEKGKW